MTVNFRGQSKFQKIVALHDSGMSRSEIVRTLNTTHQHVHKALVHHKRISPKPAPKTMTISAVTREEYKWLCAEARRIGIKARDIARAMLSDAINEAMEGK